MIFVLFFFPFMFDVYLCIHYGNVSQELTFCSEKFMAGSNLIF